MRIEQVRRLFLGSFVRPPEETGGAPRVEPVYGYAVQTPAGLLVLDTGLGATDELDPETDAWYRPRRVSLSDALAGIGHRLDDVDLVVNCHLHFDHVGDNPLLAGRPIFCQREELATAQAGGYTFESLVDFPGATYELLDGGAEIAAGVQVLPTPGHVDGHQSLVLRCDDGTVILAGQTHDSATEWSRDALAAQASALGHQPPLPVASPWMERLLALDPRRVLFAHDASVWEP